LSFFDSADPGLAAALAAPAFAQDPAAGPRIVTKSLVAQEAQKSASPSTIASGSPTSFAPDGLLDFKLFAPRGERGHRCQARPRRQRRGQLRAEEDCGSLPRLDNTGKQAVTLRYEFKRVRADRESAGLGV